MPEEDYITMGDIALYVFQFREDVDGPAFELIIPRACRIFDILCGVSPGYFRKIDANAVAAERVFYGAGLSFLTLPPHVDAIIEVKVPAGYTLPSHIAQEGTLFITDASGLLVSPGLYPDYVWQTGVAVTVKAKWGYESTPDDVKEAVAELAVAIWRSKDSAFLKQVQLEGNVTVNEAIPKRTRMIVAAYRTPAFGAAFI